MGHSELDIFLPSLNTAIEFDGLYWHSSEKSKIRDRRKDNYCKNMGIRLIRVKEWKYNQKHPNTIYFERKRNNYEWLITCLCEELKLPFIKVNIVEDTPSILDRLDLINSETSLAKKCPDAITYWNYEKNAPITPEKIGYKSHHVFSWHCPECGNDFEAPVFVVSPRKYICKECGQIKRLNQRKKNKLL